MTEPSDEETAPSAAFAETSGTFVVAHADDAGAVLRDVETAQVHALSANPGLAEGEVLDATLAPEPPLGVAWELREERARRTVEVIDSDLEPTARSKSVAAETPVGEVATHERAGAGEIHVLSVPPEAVEDAAADVLADDETVARAARLGAVRVEVRRDADEGVLSVRYLPD